MRVNSARLCRDDDDATTRRRDDDDGVDAMPNVSRAFAPWRCVAAIDATFLRPNALRRLTRVSRVYIVSLSRRVAAIASLVARRNPVNGESYV
jgi:hypothetical protein